MGFEVGVDLVEGVSAMLGDTNG